MPHGMWDLRPPTRDQTHVPCIASQVLKPLDRQGSPPSPVLSHSLGPSFCSWKGDRNPVLAADSVLDAGPRLP